MKRDVRVRLRAAALLAMIAAAPACVSPPRETEASRRIRRNPVATVEGIVRDEDGRPAAGLSVRGLPHGEGVPWFPAVLTDCAGKFRLDLAAPGSYGFLLGWEGTTVVTDSPRDPALIELTVRPGQTRGGVELLFLGDRWRALTESAPAGTPSCP